jgi:hypothetical protein
MATEYCPRCGAARIGSFRYCRSCQFDFESSPDAQPPQVAAPPPAAAVSTPTKSFSEQYAGTPFGQPGTVAPEAPVPVAVARPGWLVPALVIGVLAVAFVAFLVLSGAFDSKKVISQSNMPPNGEIWFGSTYDPSTFALSGQTTSVSAGTAVALVATLTRPGTAGERLTINTTIAGTQVPIGFAIMDAGYNVMADHLTGSLFALPGTYVIEVQDAGGNVLANGTLTVT